MAISLRLESQAFVGYLFCYMGAGGPIPVLMAVQQIPFCELAFQHHLDFSYTMSNFGSQIDTTLTELVLEYSFIFSCIKELTYFRHEYRAEPSYATFQFSDFQWGIINHQFLLVHVYGIIWIFYIFDDSYVFVYCSFI